MPWPPSSQFPRAADTEDDARYIRHVDNEDGRNGRAMAAMDHPLNTSSFQRFGSFCGISRGCSGLVTCTFYLNEDWDEEKDGGEIRLSQAQLCVAIPIFQEYLYKTQAL